MKTAKIIPVYRNIAVYGNICAV